MTTAPPPNPLLQPGSSELEPERIAPVSTSLLRGFLLSRSSPLGFNNTPVAEGEDRSSLITIPRFQGVSLTAPSLDLPDTDG